jgi:hypothetical protein
LETIINEINSFRKQLNNLLKTEEKLEIIEPITSQSVGTTVETEGVDIIEEKEHTDDEKN